MTSILIAPSAGWVDDAGAWSSGARFGHMCEAELSHAVAEELAEELDLARMRYQLLPTKHHPGLTPAARLERIEPGTIFVGIGFPGPTRRHVGLVHYGKASSEPLAEMMSEGLAMWGKAHWHGYTMPRNPKKTIDPILTVPETLAIMVEPFSLEHDSAETLATRRRSLAQSIRWGLEEFLRGREHAIVRPGIYRGRCYG